LALQFCFWQFTCVVAMFFLAIHLCCCNFVYGNSLILLL
jgi:hypothetical protein